MFSFTRTTNRTRGGIIAMIALTVIMAVGGAPPSATADVLYDSTWMTDNQTWDAVVMSHIVTTDQNAADDFTLGGMYNINTVSADFITSGTGFAGQGVLVEFFADIGSKPNNSPVGQFFATEANGLTVSSFDNHLSPGAGLRFSIDLSGAGITLDAGTWWMSIVAVHEGGSQTYHWVRQKNFVEGTGFHVRNGGDAHGNGLGGPYSSDWQLFSGLGNPIVFPPGDLAMKIEGTLVPAPGALALLGLAGMFGGGRRRKNV